MNKVYTSGTTENWFVSPTIADNAPQPKLLNKIVWAYDVYESRQVTTNTVQYFEPSMRSKDALPANHQAWLDLENLFIELDAIDFPDDMLDDTWLSDLRATADNRINEWYDSEDWQ